MIQVKDNLEISQATEADYDDVISIRDDVYKGLDYLPSLYKKMLLTNEGYIARVNGLPVAFNFTAFLDDGESFCLRSSRVRKEYEGKGVFRKLRAYVMSIMKCRPGALRQLGCFTEEGPLHKFETKEFSLTMKRSVINYRQTREGALSNCQRSNATNINQSDVKILDKCDIIASFEQKDILYPEDRILLDWVPCRLLPSNIDKFWEDDRFLAVGTTEDDKFKFISLGFWRICSKGVCCVMDLYGNLEMSLAQHIKIYLDKFIEIQEQAVYFKIYYRECKDEELIRKVMEECGSEIFTHTHSFFYVENKIKP